MGRSSPSDVVRDLVANAEDFINHAVDDLEASPKYAAIHFYAGIEILLKARLALEHWALVFDDPRSAQRDLFIRGDFRSVGLNEALKRLHGVTGKPIPGSASDVFGEVQQRRNRLVHFSNPAEETVEQVVAEQLRAWYELHLLLTRTWAGEFASHAEAIERIDQRMHGQRRFLEHKAEQLKARFATIRKRGGVLYGCPACGFGSVQSTARFGELEFGCCLVCRLDCRWLWFDDEGKLVRLGEGAVPLDSPSDVPIVELGDLVEAYIPFQRPEDRLFEPAAAYCCACELTDCATVVPWKAGQLHDSWEPDFGTPPPPLWLCINCLETPDMPSKCEWCGEYVTGEVGDYWNPRCFMCGYYIEQEVNEMERRPMYKGG